MDVIPLPSNRPADRFYRGGRKITEFRESRPPVTASVACLPGSAAR